MQRRIKCSQNVGPIPLIMKFYEKKNIFSEHSIKSQSQYGTQPLASFFLRASRSTEDKTMGDF